MFIAHWIHYILAAPRLIVLPKAAEDYSLLEDAERDEERVGRQGVCVLLQVCHSLAARQGDRKKCLDTGCDGYLAKPIDRKKLVKLVRDYAHTSAADYGVATAVEDERSIPNEERESWIAGSSSNPVVIFASFLCNG